MGTAQQDVSRKTARVGWVREKEPTPLQVSYFRLSFFCSWLRIAFTISTLWTGDLVYKRSQVLNYYVPSHGYWELAKNVITFFLPASSWRARNNFVRRHRKGGGGQKSFYCLANVKFKLLSVVSVVDGSRFKNIFPQYRRNHAVSCETAVWWCFGLKLRK